MDKHAAFLENLCRLSGNSVKNKADVAKKTAFKRELLEKFNINTDEDSSETHPEKICPSCIEPENWEIQLKFPYQEQFRSGQAM